MQADFHIHPAVFGEERAPCFPVLAIDQAEVAAPELLDNLDISS
jgi:hypothetical protein